MVCRSRKGRYQWVAQPGGFPSYPIPYSYHTAFPHRSQGTILVWYATLLSGAAASARTKRISPGLARGLAAALGRSTHSLAHPILFPSYSLVSFFLYYRPHYLSLSIHLSFSFYFALRLTEPDFVAKFLSRVSPIRCCVRAVKYA